MNDKMGVTALHLAAASKATLPRMEDVIGLLIQYGSVIGAKDKAGNQPIHYKTCLKKVYYSAKIWSTLMVY